MKRTLNSKTAISSKKIYDAESQVLFRISFHFHSLIYLTVSPAGVKALQDSGVEVISVDPCADPECVAESAALTRWKFQDLKSANKRRPEVDLVLHGTSESE